MAGQLLTAITRPISASDDLVYLLNRSIIYTQAYIDNIAILDALVSIINGRNLVQHKLFILFGTNLAF